MKLIQCLMAAFLFAGIQQSAPASTEIFPAVPPSARGQPSFDCQKAGNATEKRICADADLARLDRSLTTLYRGLTTYFKLVPQVPTEQKSWIVRRNECGEDSKCISQRYQERIQLLSGQNPDYLAAGVFRVQKEGSFDSFALYPLSSGKYLIDISTTEGEGADVFTCGLTGSAQKDGNGLRVTVPDVLSETAASLSFHVSLPDPETLVIEHSHEVGPVQEQSCGAGATLEHTFKRRGPVFNWPPKP
jgi:uncharacterized protein